MLGTERKQKKEKIKTQPFTQHDTRPTDKRWEPNDHSSNSAGATASSALPLDPGSSNSPSPGTPRFLFSGVSIARDENMPQNELQPNELEPKWLRSYVVCFAVSWFAMLLYGGLLTYLLFCSGIFCYVVHVMLASSPSKQTRFIKHFRKSIPV